MAVRAHGIEVSPPTGWEAEIYHRAPEPGEQTHPILHAGTFPLPNRRGDFGSGAVDVMGPDDVLVVLFEYEPEAAGQPLFARQGIPVPTADDFSRRALQRTLPGQSGWQSFFTFGERAFCLYVVLGSHHRRRVLLPQVHALLARLRLSELRRPTLGASA